jgi:hypothetical protein
MQSAAQRKIRCRQIQDEDLGAAAELLSRGFPGRTLAYWQRGLERQRQRDVPADLPHYGYLLEADGVPVGVILLLCTPPGNETGANPRCNLSSWYVEPAFRSHASLLISFALKHKHVTYTNISPAPHTWPTVEAQGFKRYSSGQFFAITALNASVPGLRLREVGSDASESELASLPHGELLSAHARYDCTSIVCHADDGDYPFIFQRYRIRSGRIPLPIAQLVYCHDIANFVRFAGPLGRYLARRGMPFIVLDANGPVEGLAGLMRRRRRKYFRGEAPPRLGDLAYTELVLFGP